MNSNVESMSYVTYEYNVCPRIVEKHTSSNRVQTTINGADIRITLDSISLQPDKSNILYKINILNKGNIIARQLNVIDTLNNISFIEGTLCINGYKIRDHDLKNGFFFKQLNPNDQINISFKVKANIYGDITNIVSGFYYFINDKNEKIYRKVLSNLNKITLNCSHLLFDVKYDNSAMSLNNSKHINIILKNIGNKDAKKAKLNILLPNELKLDYENIFVEEKKVMPHDKYGFFLGNLKENESYNINFNIDFKKFYGRQHVPFAICCSYYNMNEKNLYEKFDSEVLRFSVNLIPNSIR